jgi:phage tail-like protein
VPARELHEGFNFTVSVEGFPGGFHFSQCSDLAVSIPAVPYREAGAVVSVNDPGQADYAPVTLTRGASRSRELYDWVSDTLLAGVPPVAFPVRKEVQIFQRGRQLSADGLSKEILQVYTLHRAFPTSFVAGQWDNNSDSVVIQTMELTFDYYTLKVRKVADQRPATGL